MTEPRDERCVKVVMIRGLRDELVQEVARWPLNSEHAVMLRPAIRGLDLLMLNQAHECDGGLREAGRAFLLAINDTPEKYEAAYEAFRTALAGGEEK